MPDFSQRERIEYSIKDIYNTPAEYLWASYPDFAVYRHPVSKKWFCLIMEIDKSRLIAGESGNVNVMNIKSGPVMTGSLTDGKVIFPAYHMNKANWVSVVLDDTLTDEEIISLIDLSYDNVSPKIKKKK